MNKELRARVVVNDTFSIGLKSLGNEWIFPFGSEIVDYSRNGEMVSLFEKFGIDAEYTTGIIDIYEYMPDEEEQFYTLWFKNMIKEEN